jgi:ATP-dependent DNA ligase
MDTLYNTSVTTHKTKQWRVDVVENKVVVTHGFVGGKQVVHESECQGKNIGKTNETTPNQQAMSEAKSLWDKKVKSGYSKNMADPQTTYHPMLAQEMTDKLVQYPCFVQPKLDGIRCIVYKTDQIHFQSRNHSMLQTMTHLLPELEQIFHIHPTAVLDGELYTHGMGFQKITSLVRKKDHPELSTIHYCVYDLIQSDVYTDRLQTLSTITQGLKMVHCIGTVEACNREAIERLHSLYTIQGYEGIMLRVPNGLYKQQSRSKELLKYKHFKDAEYEVVGHHEGTGGTAVFECKTKEGKIFGVTMKCTTEEKKDMLKRVHEYYGKQLTVKFQELSEDNIPRFPVGIGFRMD